MTGEFRVNEYGVGSIIDEEDLKAATEALKNSESLSWGPRVPMFEKAFAEYCGVKHAVAVTSCTAALEIATRILKIGREDEIVGTPQTFRATYVPVNSAGASIRFADIEADTLDIDPNTIEEKITPRTKAIYVMHYGGNPVDMDPVIEIAEKHGLVVVEDAAHALGTVYKGRKVGSIGDLTCFSLQSLKNMTTLGEGGFLTTNSDEYAQMARTLRTYGIIGEKRPRVDKRIGRYEPPEPRISDHSDGSWDYDWVRIDGWGIHARMNEVQAAVGLNQLKKLDKMNEMRAQVAKWYSEGLSEIPSIRLWRVRDKSRCSWHLYPCFIDRTKVRVNMFDLIHYLELEKKIRIIPRYFPVHLTDYMRYYGHSYGECPVCERVWFEEQLNLPINPRMSYSEVETAVEAVKDGITKLGKAL
ncbi:MAG: DegT/DnrJ/EryC1/StrS family aminotransferase [Thermoproteota archaeon]